MSKYSGVILVLVLVIVAYSKWDTSWESTDNLGDKHNIRFTLNEVSSENGVSFSYKGPVLDRDLSPSDFYIVGGGMAVHDVNNDGWMDFYVVTAHNGSKNHLYINQNGEGFKEQAAEWGIADLNGEPVVKRKYSMSLDEPELTSSMAPIFFDYNNDGLVDLFVARLGCSILLKNDGKKFIDVTEDLEADFCLNAQSALPIDVNQDGFLDLYLLRYYGPHNLFELDSDDVWVNSLFNATNGGTNTLYLNQAGQKFVDVTDERGGADYHFSLDANFGEFSNEGAREVLVSNDYGPDVLYRLVNGKFIDVSVELGSPDRRLGMGVTPAYLEGDRPYVHVSNAFHPMYRNEGNFLWKFSQSSGATDLAIAKGTNNCGWAWSAAFVDFDSDSDLDLYVSNGFISSNNSNARDISFSLGTLQSLPGAVTSDVGQFEKVVGNLEDENFQFAGNEIDCVFLNEKNKFNNVSKTVGISSAWDGRVASVIDIDNDGAQELLVNTRNKGLKLLQSSIKSPRNWVGFRIRSKSLKRDLEGVKVSVKQGKRTWKRFTTGGKSGFLSISDPRVHVSLENELPVQVEVVWQNGKKDQLLNLVPGSYYEIWQD